MNSPYRYCSRCGEELDEQIRERYEEKHSSGPVLCIPCIREVIQGIPKAVQSIADVFADAFQEAFSPFLKDHDSDD